MYLNEELEKEIINKIFKKKIQNESIELILGVLGGVGFLGFLLYLFFKNTRTINHRYVSDSYSEPKLFNKIETSVDDFKQEIPTLNIEPDKKRDITKDVEKIQNIDTKLRSVITERNKIIDIILNILDDEKKSGNKKIDFIKIKEFLQSIREGYQGIYLESRIQSIQNQKKHISDTKKPSYEKQTFDLQAVIYQQSEKLRELKDTFAKINLTLPENSKFITMHDLHFGPKSYQKIEQTYDQKIKTSESLIFSVKLKKIKDLEFKIEDIELTDISKGNLFYNKKGSFFQFFNEEGSYELDEVDEDYFMSILSSKKIIFSKFKKDSNELEETFEDEDLNPYESLEPKENIEFSNDDVEDLNEKNAKTNEYEKLLEDSIKKIKSNLNDQKQFLLDNYSDNSDPEILEIISNYNNGIDEELKNLSDIDIKKTSLNPLLVDNMIEDIIDANDNWNKEFTFITNAIKNKIGIRVDNTNQEKPSENLELKNVIDDIDEKSLKENKEIIELAHNDLISFLNKNKENILEKYKDIKNPKIEENIKDFIKSFIEQQKSEIEEIDINKIIKDKTQLKDYLNELIDKDNKFKLIVNKFYSNVEKNLNPDAIISKEEKTPLSLTISKIEKNKRVEMPIEIKGEKIKLLDSSEDSDYYIVFLPGDNVLKPCEIYSKKNINVFNEKGIMSIILESKEKYPYKIYEGNYILVKNDKTNKTEIKLQIYSSQEDQDTLKEKDKKSSFNQVLFVKNEDKTMIGDIIQPLYSTYLKREKDLEKYDKILTNENIKNLWKTYIISKKDGSEISKYIIFNKKILILKSPKGEMTVKPINEQGVPLYLSYDVIKNVTDIFKMFPATLLFDSEEIVSSDYNLVFGNNEDEQNKLIKELNLVPFKKYNCHIVNYKGRFFVLRKIDGVIIPFYLSSGQAEKENVPSGKWYAVAGISDDGWIIKLGQNRPDVNIIVKNFYIQRLIDAADQLNQKIGNVNKIDLETIRSIISVEQKLILDDVNQSFKTKVEKKENFDQILLRILELYKILGIDKKVYMNNLINSLHYDSNYDMNSIKRKFKRAGIDITEFLSNNIEQKEGKTLLQGVINTLSAKEDRAENVSYPIKIKDNKIIFIEKISNKEDEFYIKFTPLSDNMGECKIYSKEDKQIFNDDLLEDSKSILFESINDFKYEIHTGLYRIEDNKIILDILYYKDMKNKETSNLSSEDKIQKIINKIDDLKIDNDFINFIQDVLSKYYVKFIKGKINNPNYKNLISLDPEHETNFIKNDKIIYNRKNNKISLGFKFKSETIGGEITHNIYFFDQTKKDFIPYDTMYFAQYNNPSHKFNLIEILKYLYSIIKSDINSLLDQPNFTNYSILFIDNEEINNYILNKIKDDSYVIPKVTKKQEITVEKPKEELPFFGFFQEETTTVSKTSKIEPLEIDSVSELNQKLKLNKKIYFYIKNTAKPNEQLFYIEINENNFKPLLQYLKDNKKLKAIKIQRNNYFDEGYFQNLIELNTKFTTMSDDSKIEDENIPVFGVINIKKGKYEKSGTFLPEDIILTSKKINSDESYFWNESFERTLIKKYFSNKK